MSTKQQAMKLKKQAKRKAASKAKTKHNNRQEHYGRMVMNQERAAWDKRYAKNRGAYAAENGLANAIEYFRGKDRREEGQQTEITNKWVLQFMNEAIPQFVKVHAGIEVICRLEAEKRFTLDEHQRALITEFDRSITTFTEDINAVNVFIEGDKEPHDYIEVVYHMVDNVGMAMSSLFEQIIDNVLTPHHELANQYATEHMSEGMELYGFMMLMHEDRMKEVAPLYRTKVQPYEPFQPEAEPVDETDLANEIFQPKADDVVVDAEVVEDKPVVAGEPMLSSKEDLVASGFVEQ